MIFRFRIMALALKIFLAFFTTIFLNACSESKSEKDKVAYHHAADIMTIKPALTYKIQRQYIGEISSKQLTKLSFQFGGQVNSLSVENGDRVTKGQILAELNTELLSNNSDEINAEIKQTQAQLTLNAENLNRLDKLKYEGFTSQQSIDELNSERNVLLAGLQRLNAALANNKYQITQAQIIAPFDGTNVT